MSFCLVRRNLFLQGFRSMGPVRTHAYQSLFQDLKKLPMNEFVEQEHVYVISNEINQAEVINALKTSPKRGDCVLGVSGLYVLDLASTAKGIGCILLFDFAKAVQTFWKNTLPILAENSSRMKACDQIFRDLEDNAGTYFNPKLLSKNTTAKQVANHYQDQIKDAINEGVSFLSCDTRYQRIRDLVLEGKVHFTRQDLLDEESITRMAHCFDRHRVSFHAVYGSNLSWLDEKAYQSFITKTINRDQPKSPFVVSAKEDLSVRRFRQYLFDPACCVNKS